MDPGPLGVAKVGAPCEWNEKSLCWGSEGILGGGNLPGSAKSDFGISETIIIDFGTRVEHKTDKRQIF